MDIKTATQQTKQLANLFKGILEVGAFLESQTSLENHAKELESKVLSLRKKLI